MPLHLRSLPVILMGSLFLGIPLARVNATEAYVVQVLYSFENERPTSLIAVADGTYLGTTLGAGTGSTGRVFRATSRGVVATLAALSGDRGNDPGGVTVGGDGHLYGTTQFGSTTTGSIFRISPRGTFEELVRFRGLDGARPWGGLLHATDGYLYGTTTSGGSGGVGTVFRLLPTGAGFETLHSFDTFDGAQPLGGLVEAASGTLYGTTSLGGLHSGGTLFRITKTRQLETMVHLSRDTGSGWVFLTRTRGGDVVGTAQAGGDAEQGTFFRIGHDDQIHVLAAFGHESGSFPKGVVEGSGGLFFGVSEQGGSHNQGTMFRIDSEGAITTLAEFDEATGTKARGLVVGADGQLYGVAFAGGAKGFGSFFRAVRTPMASISLSSEGSVVTHWNTFPGGDYRLEFTPTLRAASWQPVLDRMATSDLTSVTNRFLSAPNGFFRVVLRP